MASTLKAIADRVTKEAAIDAAETPFADLVDETPFLQLLVSEAIADHNELYTIDSLPEREVPLVVILARIKVADIRAQKWANDPNVSGANGFGADRNTPFQKNLALITYLTAKYASACSALGIIVTASPLTSIKVSDVRIRDIVTDTLTPETNNWPPTLAISLNALVSTTGAIFDWTLPTELSFATSFQAYSFAILELELADTTSVLVQPWNYESTTGVPGINDAAQIVSTNLPYSSTQAKVTGLDLTTKKYYVALVMSSLTGKTSYSNAVLVQAPA